MNSNMLPRCPSHNRTHSGVRDRESIRDFLVGQFARQRPNGADFVGCQLPPNLTGGLRILGWGDKAQVRRVDTSSIATRMVKVHPRRNHSNALFIRDSVGEARPFLARTQSIPVTVHPSTPNPAPGHRVNVMVIVRQWLGLPSEGVVSRQEPSRGVLDLSFGRAVSRKQRGFLATPAVTEAIGDAIVHVHSVLLTLSATPGAVSAVARQFRCNHANFTTEAV